MTDLVQRFSVDSLLRPDAPARVMQPDLRDVPVHWHDYYELGLVLSGSAEHVVNGVAHTIGRGSAFLVSPADFHAFRVIGGDSLTCYNVVVGAAAMERQLAALAGPADLGFPWQCDDFLDAERDFERLRDEFDRPRIGSTQVAEALVACLVVALARRCGLADPARARTGVGDADLRAAVLHVDRHFREPLTLSEVAAQAHLSPNYFSERFRDYAGISFQRYLQECRLRFAHSLLGSTALGVADVCHAAGFNNVSHFGRAYRRRYGVPPSAGRRPKITM